MSYAALEWCRSLPLRGWTKAVLWCLADHHNDQTGRCDPSIPTIVFEMGCNEKTARKALNDLAALGAIVRTPRAARADLIELAFDWRGVPETAGVPNPVPPPSRKRYPHGARNGTTPLPNQVPKPESTINEPEVTHESPKPSEPPDSASFDFGSVVSQGNGGSGHPGNRAIDAWNATATRREWPIVQSRSPPRLRAVQARLGEIGGLDGWALMLGKLEATPWLSKQGFLSFDWITKPTNLAKLMEGNYDRDTSRAEAEPTGISSILAAFGRPGAGG